MIKLILSDVDGTLLDHGKVRLPDRVFQVIEALEKQNIVFAAASGRGYSDLAELFLPVKDRIAFVCSDGAMTVYQDRVLDLCPMDKEQAVRLCWDISGREGCEYLLYGRDLVYAHPKTMQYQEFLKGRYGDKLRLLQSPSGVEDDFLKVAVYSARGVERHAKHFIGKWQDTFDIVYNANVWMELVAKDVSKVRGVLTLCRHFGIELSQVMAFGDGGNDVKLLQTVGCGYAMDYAREYVKDAADHITEDVMETIEKTVLHGSV